MKIYEAEITDAEILAQIGTKTFYDTFARFHDEEDIQAYLKKAYDKKLIEQNLSNPLIQYHLACDENYDVIGYTKLLHTVLLEKFPNKRVIELEKIYVLKSVLGKKVGAALMQNCIEYAKQKNYDAIFLGVWQENKKAIDFYKQFNFKIFDTRSFQLGKTICDDYLMLLEI